METRDRGRAWTLMVVAALVVVAGITVFRVPLTSIFVLGIALLCPLMMFGMHGGGHGHGAGHEGSSGNGHHAVGSLSESNDEEVDR